jgi:hypothetical protein
MTNDVSGKIKSSMRAAAFLSGCTPALTRLVGWAVCGAVCGSRLLAAEPSPEDLEFFEKQVRPILVESCQQCHGARKQEGGLRLDSREGVLKGGDSGAVVAERKPDESLLVEAIRYKSDLKMPPKTRLSDEQVAILGEWVRRGIPWPAEGPRTRPEDFDLEARKAKQWALQPVSEPSPPDVKSESWCRSAIDRFILARLEAAGVTPAAPAEKSTLIRRAYFDLIGLPPTEADIDAFLQDASGQAFERVVERLLDSPHYGERWARHWLDLVRYAESCGHEFDYELPYAYEYRDYVIRALNADIPYDQFVVEHIAGDLVPAPRRHPLEGFNESIIGTGFWFLGEAKHSPVDIRADEAERMDNQIDVFAKAILAQTLGCARCHDHKFDAISTKDYYALAGYLQSSRYAVTSIDAPEERQEVVRQLLALREKQRQIVEETAAQNAERSAARFVDLLLAALSVLRPEGSENTPQAELLETAAKKRGLEPTALQDWIIYLEQHAAKDSSDPLHLWALLTDRSVDLTAAGLSAFVNARRAGLKEAGDRERGGEQNSFLFEDFSQRDFGGWFVSGEAWGAGPVDLGFEIGGAPFGAALAGLRGARVAHSGALAARLEGTLRSRTFTIENNHILYHLGGRGAKISLIIDGYQLIRDPIYGALTIALDRPDRMQWYVQDVNKWVGHNAYIELVDPGDGFLAVDRILFSDGGAPQEPVNPVSRAILEGPGLDSAQAVARCYGRLAEQAMSAEKGAKPQASQNAERAIQAIRGFLLTSKLEGALPRTLAVSRPNDLRDIAQSKDRLERSIRYTKHAMTIIDGSPEDDCVHLRGNPNKFGESVPRRFLEALAGAGQPAPETGSGRLELARRVVDPRNPVVARVIVNRVWKQHFGEGLVRTPDDFGNMGQPPSHPELLDFLAGEFVKQGWSLKRLHKMVMLSQTYGMSSHPADEGTEERDPQNRLLHRMNLRRLEAEAIRDAMLAVSGRLDSKMFGPGVAPWLTPFMIGRGRPAQSGPLDGDGRRTVYLSVRRNFLNPMLLAFDSPIPFSTIGRRSVSNVPAQALALMNNPFVIEQSQLWAQRAAAANSPNAERIRAMYIAAYARPPSERELQEAEQFITEQSQGASGGEAPRPWADLAHVLFNAKEFIFVE